MKFKKHYNNFKFRRKGIVNYNNTTKAFSKRLHKAVRTTELNYKKSIITKMECLVGSKNCRAK